jgi:predicted nucleic acid-binding protein
MLTGTDTGILLRLLDRADPRHAAIRQALRVLRARGDEPVTSTQNIAEFWNVCTRPAAARGGFGLTVPETERRVRLLERLFRVLPDSPAAYPLWRQLVVRHGVQGVQVHDARLVAWMECHGITHLLTLNTADFARYPGITAWAPEDLLGP